MVGAKFSTAERFRPESPSSEFRACQALNLGLVQLSAETSLRAFPEAFVDVNEPEWLDVIRCPGYISLTKITVDRNPPVDISPQHSHSAHHRLSPSMSSTTLQIRDKPWGHGRVKFLSLVLFLTCNSYSINPNKIVSKDEFDAKVAAAYQNKARVETPPEDVQSLANLLSVSPETLSGTGAGFNKGGEACGHCGRAFSLLDIAATGLQVHGNQFLVDVVMGKYGYIVNTAPQPFNCYKCGTKPPFPEPDYDIVFYVCDVLNKHRDNERGL
ncbi:hypothetical protein DFH07DRAFT_977180 [Mycena maculata]|uniref:Uncharacterized protein n=1 Tax=Mycena maculata TaxID=230809 RepID=A0AAD7N494_9AGAR|nr:hypothetical protein DFH07DRAFT_977180 [Mycena maculata]